MDPGIFCRTEAIGDHELYQGFTQDHSDLMGRMINFCRHWQNTFALHLQFLCDQLRGCPCKTFFNQAVWQNTYKPFIDEMHTWNRNLLVHLRDPKCLVENSEKFGEFQHRYLRLAASILEWQGRHAEHQENYLSQSLCTPCLETSERVHRQALNYLYFNRAPTLDISVGDEILPHVDPGLCRGCRNLLHPFFARRVPPPTNPLGMTRRFAARCQAYYYLGNHRTGAAARDVTPAQQTKAPFTPLQTLAAESAALTPPPSTMGSTPTWAANDVACDSDVTYYEGWDTPPPLPQPEPLPEYQQQQQQQQPIQQSPDTAMTNYVRYLP